MKLQKEKPDKQNKKENDFLLKKQWPNLERIYYHQMKTGLIRRKSNRWLSNR